MNNRKVNTWTIVSVGLLIVGLLVSLPVAAPRPTLAQLPEPFEFSSPQLQDGVPTVSTDEEGYTLWTVDWSNLDFCAPYSRYTYPMDLSGYDPTAISDPTLFVTYSQMQYTEQIPGDPTWTVVVNGKPPSQWRSLGTIGGPVNDRYVFSQWTTAEVPFPDQAHWLIDGENKFWLKQHDACPTDTYPDAACTCIELHTMQLRALLDLKIMTVFPQDDARHLRVDTPVRVRFSRPVTDGSVNAETFQLYYYDQHLNQIPVAGGIRRESPNEFTFTPSTPLKPGVRYYVKVWGHEDALAAGRDKWVIGPNDFILTEGRAWSFWTLPDVQVELVPVQVLENMPLIVNKATALRTFIHWEYHEDVYLLDQVELIEVYDILLRWQSLLGAHSDSASWRDRDGSWNLPYSFENARRKREYRIFNTPLDSYDKFERMAGRDSITYFGFSPVDAGTYTLSAFVTLLDHEGEPTIARLAAVQRETFTAPVLNIHHRAGAVGTDYGASGTMNLGTAIHDSLNIVRALFPVPNVTRPPDPRAIPYHHPSTKLYIKSWASNPWWPYTQHAYLLQELSELCVATTGCDFMIGYVPQPWMGGKYIGTVERWIAPKSALLVHDVEVGYDAHFAMAHELGHLYQFDTHDDALRGGEGYMVSHRVDLRYSVAQMSPKTTDTMNDIKDFMHEKPQTQLRTTGGRYACRDCVWIHPSRYQSLITKITGVTPRAMGMSDGLTASPMLMVSGVITPATGDTFLMPWYQLDLDNSIPPVAGPYQLVFVDDADQAIAGHTHSFDVSSALHFDDLSVASMEIATPAPAWFLFTVPYPQNAARIQIRRISDNELLAERTVSTSAPSLTLHAPPAVWTGKQPITWDAAPDTFFVFSVSTDGGTTWEALAINFDDKQADLETTTLPNTMQAYIRVAATDGVRTTTAVTGPFTIANPPVVSYVTPPPGSVADPALPLMIGFRDAMDAATLNEQTITLSGGPYGTVSGAVVYDTLEREATFTPRAPLAYNTVYTAQVSTGVRDSAGTPLPAAFTWTFTTTLDTLPPVPLTFSPARGTQHAPADTAVIVLWNKALDPVTLTPERFTLATAEGITVSGAIAYDAAAHTLTFQPAADLLTGPLYLATLHPGIADLEGNETIGEYRWTFRTGARAATGLRFTGAYADWGVDTNGDGLYEQLVIQVGVQTPLSGDFTLQGVLADAAGAEIGWTTTEVNVAAGTHFIALTFDGAEIGGRGVDGPYTLARLTLTAPGKRVIWATDAYRTFAYTAAHFPAPLRFGDLPDLLLTPGTNLTPAFNVRDYAQHITQPSAALTYTLLMNTNPDVGVTLDAAGNIHVNPKIGWGIVWTEGTRVTVQASYGAERVQDTFYVAVGWRSLIYLPLTLRQYQPGAQAARNYWQIAIDTDFEEPSFGAGWSEYEYKTGIDPARWGRRDCNAYSGQYSMWAFSGWGSVDYPCGAHYPPLAGFSVIYLGDFNLRYAAQAELRMKAWTNLGPGDELCALASLDPYDPYNKHLQSYYGVCRSGQTNGWEDLVLDLSKVPTLGNLLGQESVWLTVRIQTQGKNSLPIGAYIDDVELRLCPQGLDCYAPPGPAPIPVGQPTLTGGSIGGYAGEIEEMVIARETNGRVHALWTGKMNPHFEPFVYYATSPDGQTWTPFTIVTYDASNNPRIAVDEMRQRVHLMYRGNGIVHHVIENDTISLPIIVTADNTGSWDGVRYPSITIAPETGHAHALWLHAYTAWIEYPSAAALRYRTWYAYWDGERWSPRQRVINDDDTWDSRIVAGTDGSLMLVWFQRWQQSQPQSHLGDPGEPTTPRSAYGLAATPGRFPLRQSTPTMPPRGDDSIMLAYSPGDGKYYMFNWHRMWPGYSVAYRYVWENETWSDPINVAQNADGYVAPLHIGAATETPLVCYVYSENSELRTRTEINGVLGSVVNLADYLSARGYSVAPETTFPDAVLAYFTDAAGDLHLILAGEKNGVPGFYYVQP
jgi:hypothetical protein